MTERSAGVVAGGAPAIPAPRMHAGWLREVGLLLWVHTGAARVERDGEQPRRIAAGEGIWLPAGAGGRISTDPGTVAFPHHVPPSTATGAPVAEARFLVPDAWRDWLIVHFVRGVVDIPIFGHSRHTLLDVLRTPEAVPRAPTPVLPPRDAPGLPMAAAARIVAQELRAHPALGHTIDDWATLVACSVSTLRRGFAGTGLTFAQWRTRTRLAAACEFIAARHDLEHVARQVGFVSRNGFTRAFREHYGITPSDYVSRIVNASHAPSQRVAAARESGTVTRLLAESTVLPQKPADPGPLPIHHLPVHTNDVHVLSWVYRGRTTLRVGEIDHPNQQGDAVWIPAGVEHRYDTHRGSLAIPVGDLRPADAFIPQPVRVRFPPGWNNYLLHRAIATRTVLRPEDFDPRSILDVFRDQLAIQRAHTVPMPDDPRALAVARRFLRDLSATTGTGPGADDPRVVPARDRDDLRPLAGYRPDAHRRRSPRRRRTAQHRRTSPRLQPGLELQPRLHPVPRRTAEQVLTTGARAELIIATTRSHRFPGLRCVPGNLDSQRMLIGAARVVVNGGRNQFRCSGRPAWCRQWMPCVVAIRCESGCCLAKGRARCVAAPECCEMVPEGPFEM